MLERKTNLTTEILELIEDDYCVRTAAPAVVLKNFAGFLPKRVRISRKLESFNLEELEIYEKYYLLDKTSTIYWLVGNCFVTEGGWLVTLNSKATHLMLWGYNPGEFAILSIREETDPNDNISKLNISLVPTSEYGVAGDWTPSFNDIPYESDLEYVNATYDKLVTVYSLEALEIVVS